jgi:lipoate-protein ligase A
MFLAFPLNLEDLQNAILNSNLTEKDYDSHDFFIQKTCITLLSSMQDLIDQIEMGEGFSVHCEKEWSQFIKYYSKTYKRSKKIFHRYLKRLKLDYWEQEELVRNILWVTKLINSGFYETDEEDVYFHAVILSGKFFTSVFYYNYLINEACDRKINSPESLFNTRKNLSSIKDERLWIEETYNQLKDKEIDEVPEETKEMLFALWDRTFDFVQELIKCFSKTEALNN